MEAVGRRSFLGGMFAGIIGGSTMLVKATDADIAAFASPLKVGDPIRTVEAEVMDSDAPTDGIGSILFDYKGRPVAIITHMCMTREVMDMTSIFSDIRQYRGGSSSIEIRAQGCGEAQGRNAMELLRGNFGRSYTKVTRG